ncbi:hypothetical protein [Caldithrix abyssi]|uniref:hypothetical protein n=1 Tax=Caldithrix abyssi TaxID=187145 RepID=UPI0012372C18|nr:hypothetical protein [Caldithrix abyssi]
MVQSVCTGLSFHVSSPGGRRGIFFFLYRSLSVVDGRAFTINGCFDYAQQPIFGYAQQPYSRSLSGAEGSEVEGLP